MKITPVLITFVTSLLFNVFLPTGDVGSDVYLMIKTILFDLGDSTELAGCRSCYGKSERDVYHEYRKE